MAHIHHMDKTNQRLPMHQIGLDQPRPGAPNRLWGLGKTKPGEIDKVAAARSTKKIDQLGTPRRARDIRQSFLPDKGVDCA